MSWLEFRPWRRLEVALDRTVTRRFLQSVGREAVKVFKEGMDGPHSGRLYQRAGGRVHRASAGRRTEFPANDTGRLRASIRSRLGRDSVTVGTSMEYSKYLREGTPRMSRRRMSDDALQEGVSRSRQSLRGWVKWKRR